MESEEQTINKESILKFYFLLILNIAWKFILFYFIFSISSYYGCFYNELGSGYEFFSYFIAYVFVIVSLIFKENLFNKLKFIFSKKIILFGLMIYLIATSIAFYQTHNNINKLKSYTTFKDINITYEYGAILTSLTPRVKVSLDETYNKTQSFEIAQKLFDMPFYSRLEYFLPKYKQDGTFISFYDSYACFYNQENRFLTILQYALLVYLHIILINFLIAYKMVLKIKQPFVKFEKFELKKGVLVFWFLLLFIVSFLMMGVADKTNWKCKGVKCISYGIDNNDKKIKSFSYKNKNLIKGENYGL